MSRGDLQVKLRMPAELKASLEQRARENGRSLTAEAVLSLRQSISLRDEFAGRAMQAAIGMLDGHHFWNEGGFFTSLAKNSYEMADAMLAERAKAAP